MRVGLYGMPSAGKSRLLQKIDFLAVIEGRNLLKTIAPDFDAMEKSGRMAARRQAALRCKEKTAL